MRGRPHEIEGMKFGMLTAQHFIEKTSHGHRWQCGCDCGGAYVALASRLVSGYTNHCGCRVRELRQAAGRAKTTHGMTNSPEFVAWSSMHQRCSNPQHISYAWYGAKGITVCPEWSDFQRFYADLGPRPSPTHSVDRIDGSQPYGPANCRWATKGEQNRNRSSTVWLTLSGKTLCLEDWAAEVRLNPVTVSSRLKRGWSIEEALTAPATRRKPKRVLNTKETC